MWKPVYQGFTPLPVWSIYPTDYQLGRLTTLERLPAAAQGMMTTTEGNVVVELRLPEMQPTRFPLTCFQGRVATLCVNITLSGEMEVQIYLVPFDWRSEE